MLLVRASELYRLQIRESLEFHNGNTGPTALVEIDNGFYPHKGARRLLRRGRHLFLAT